MTKEIGKNINTTDESTSTTISVGSVTAVALVLALTSSDGKHIKVSVTNNGNTKLNVRLRSAASDNLKDGQWVSPGETETIIEQGDIYTGEISAIFNSGGLRDVSVVVL